MPVEGCRSTVDGAGMRKQLHQASGKGTERAEFGSSDLLAVDSRGVAELLGISASMVRKLDASGRLPSALRLGRRKLWRVSEIRSWLERGAPTRDAWEEMA